MFEKHNHGRKYVDLLFRTTNLYANWQPSISIRVGDYGHVDRQTGLFIRDGNVYDDDFAERYNLSIEQPTVSAKEGRVICTSRRVRCISTNAQADLGLQGSNMSFALSFQSKNERGAILVLGSPSIESIPNEGRLRALLSVKELASKCVVSQVYRCPSYAMLFTGAKDWTATVSFTAPAPTVPAIDIQVATVGCAKWNIETSGGISRHAHSENGAETYFPLCALRALGEQFASVNLKLRTAADEGLPKLPIFEPPWAELDESGEEELESEEGRD